MTSVSTSAARWRGVSAASAARTSCCSSISENGAGSGERECPSQREGRPTPSTAEDVHGRSVQVAGRIVERAHALPPLPEGEERVLHDLLGLGCVPRDGAQAPEQDPRLVREEGLEAERLRQDCPLPPGGFTHEVQRVVHVEDGSSSPPERCRSVGSSASGDRAVQPVYEPAEQERADVVLRGLLDVPPWTGRSTRSPTTSRRITRTARELEDGPRREGAQRGAQGVRHLGPAREDLAPAVGELVEDEGLHDDPLDRRGRLCEPRGARARRDRRPRRLREGARRGHGRARVVRRPEDGQEAREGDPQARGDLQGQARRHGAGHPHGAGRGLPAHAREVGARGRRLDQRRPPARGRDRRGRAGRAPPRDRAVPHRPGSDDSWPRSARPRP
jgi:hypothetical protein